MAVEFKDRAQAALAAGRAENSAKDAAASAAVADEAASVVSVGDITAPQPSSEPAPQRPGVRGRVSSVGRSIKGNRGNTDASAPVKPAVVTILPDATPAIVDEPAATPTSPPLVVRQTAPVAAPSEPAPVVLPDPVPAVGEVDALNQAIRKHIADGTPTKVLVKDIYSRFDDGSAEALERIDDALQMKGA